MIWTTNHNKAVGHGWSVSQSQHHASPVGHIRWLQFQWLVSTLCWMSLHFELSLHLYWYHYYVFSSYNPLYASIIDDIPGVVQSTSCLILVSLKWTIGVLP